MLHRPFFIRLLHWEYWSFHTIYLPIYIVWIGLCLRARSFFFFAASNPSIKNGGFLNESKKDIQQLIPKEWQLNTAFFSLPANADAVVSTLRRQDLRFPLIGKPDIGGRGRGVRVLKDENDVHQFVSQAYLNFHIQEFVPFKKEVGIFYYRNPAEESGHLSGIVRKEFLQVKGDGIHEVRYFLQQNPRSILQLKKLEKLNKALLDSVPAAGEEVVVVPYGNHARGAEFLDDSYLIDAELTATIDGICRQIPDFYFGRLDIRYKDWEELKKGRSFAIIEVNGAGSEPTHIYDPRHSIFFAWKEIIRHWKILWMISRENHRRGHRYLTTLEGIRMFNEDKLISQKLAAMQ
ncbi:MAG TPA: ATP-grasp domain-containing protein [Puia sp.]|nr:ATP-grasp domain-containing protein [Puia sp.]